MESPKKRYTSIRKGEKSSAIISATIHFQLYRKRKHNRYCVDRFMIHSLILLPTSDMKQKGMATFSQTYEFHRLRLSNHGNTHIFVFLCYHYALFYFEQRCKCLWTRVKYSQPLFYLYIFITLRLLVRDNFQWYSQIYSGLWFMICNCRALVVKDSSREKSPAILCTNDASWVCATLLHYFHYLCFQLHGYKTI